MSERARGSAEAGEPEVSGEQATLLAGPDAPPPWSGTRAPVGEDWSGREIAGRYVVRERLGEGGMGVVYVAEHLHLKRRVALKVIHPHLAKNEALLLRFEREALATGQLDHPHIAAAIDFGMLDDGGAFIVMPLVRGRSLQHELDMVRRLEARRVALLGAQIADALSAAHALGIVHRDLKPDNVLLEKRNDGSEAVKVLDFGVASLTGQAANISVDARPLTQAGTVLGTPGYMSPEQATAGEVDHRTDLYALGVILWELCRGTRLFDGNDITQIFAKQFAELPPALDLGLQPGGRVLSQLVAQLLAWDKSERPSSAAEVRDALRAIAALPEPRLPHVSLSRLTARVDALRSFLRAHRRFYPYATVASAVLLGLVLALAIGPSDEQADDGARTAASEAGAASSPLDGAVAQPKLSRTEIKAELERANQEIVGRDRGVRQAAAKTVLRHGAAAPRYLRLVADLELSSGCTARKKVLGEMRALSDGRVLPALDRLASQPPRGCGAFRLSDCLACLRRDLEQTIVALEKAESADDKR